MSFYGASFFDVHNDRRIITLVLPKAVLKSSELFTRFVSLQKKATENIGGSYKKQVYKKIYIQITFSRTDSRYA
ncbi:hypothetical protein DRF67_03120 [Chryseobacterium pennipullorum]|uniref:Uncharacterized protein n=1 Tax=Chryseobacterium pennipullorum TaxID=2258963 RepID=A0A3D9B733_9FLAO|nr:hypothetical protein DRF67_03120 [Chryseobacterium pennipullorum]